MAVVGIPDKWGELLRALIVLKENGQLTGDELKRHCSSKSYWKYSKIPKEIILFSEELPKTHVGKIIKRN